MQILKNKKPGKSVMYLLAALLIVAFFSLNAKAEPEANKYIDFEVLFMISEYGYADVHETVTYKIGDPASGEVKHALPKWMGVYHDIKVLDQEMNLMSGSYRVLEEQDEYIVTVKFEEGLSTENTLTVTYQYQISEFFRFDDEKVRLVYGIAAFYERDSINKSSVTVKLPEELSVSTMSANAIPDGDVGDELHARVVDGRTFAFESGGIPPGGAYVAECLWPASDYIPAPRITLPLINPNERVDPSKYKKWDFARFDVDISLNRDGTYRVRETQIVNFYGSFSFLYRDISLADATGAYYGDTAGAVRAYDIKVLELDGTPTSDKWSASTSGSNLEIRIDFKAKNEQKAWIIEYSYKGAYIFSEAYQRLYYNTLSIDRDVKIWTSLMSFQAPDLESLNDIAATYYVNQSNPPRSYTSWRENDIIFWAATYIPQRTTFTIDIELPSDFAEMPILFKQSFKTTMIVVMSVLSVLAAIIVFLIWNFKGRDIGRRGVLVVEYDIPEGVQPAVLSALMSEKAKLNDIIATIIDLANRGYIKIVNEESGSFKLEKTKDPSDLDEFEKITMESIFEGGRNETAFSDIDEKFYANNPKIMLSIMNEVNKRGYMEGNMHKARRRYKIISLLLGFIPMVLVMYLCHKFDLGYLYIAFMPFLTFGVFMMVFSRWMSRKSKTGSSLHERGLGLREYIKTAESEELRNVEPNKIFALLPIAIALGVRNEWAERFGAAITTPPDWYHTTSSQPFYGPTFLGSLYSFETGLRSNITSMPKSESDGWGGGGGGGGFGGGFSGGGFGGGGSRAG